jgi:hypothetical protein
MDELIISPSTHALLLRIEELEREAEIQKARMLDLESGVQRMAAYLGVTHVLNAKEL